MPFAALRAAAHNPVEGEKQQLAVLRGDDIDGALASRGGHEHISHQGPRPVVGHEQVLPGGIDALGPQAPGQYQGTGMEGVADVPDHGVFGIVLLPGVQAAQHGICLFRLNACKKPTLVDNLSLLLIHGSLLKRCECNGILRGKYSTIRL